MNKNQQTAWADRYPPVAPWSKPDVTNPETWGVGVQTPLTKSDLPVAVRERIWARDGFACVRCVELGIRAPEYEPLQVDHIRPLSEGGDNHWTNLQWLCPCHLEARQDPSISPDRAPAWIARLAREGRLVRHILRYRERGQWQPNTKGLRLEIYVLCGYTREHAQRVVDGEWT